MSFQVGNNHNQKLNLACRRVRSAAQWPAGAGLSGSFKISKINARYVGPRIVVEPFKERDTSARKRAWNQSKFEDRGNNRQNFAQARNRDFHSWTLPSGLAFLQHFEIDSTIAEKLQIFSIRIISKAHNLRRRSELASACNQIPGVRDGRKNLLAYRV